MTSILVLNGPNLNLLGTREPEHYGTATLDDIRARLEAGAEEAGAVLEFAQYNAEHQLIEQIHAAVADEVDFILFNPAAFTHTSVAIRDAVQAVGFPFIEIHLSNVHAREEFRRRSYFSDIAEGVISGLGPIGYELALQAAMARIRTG